jgi:hypothetical protein
MLENRTFRVVFVGEGHGTGIGQTALPDQIVTYSGTEIKVQAR